MSHTFDPIGAQGAPDGHVLSGATDINGNPVSQETGENADPSTVIVKYNGTPMRASTALALGLAVRDGHGRYWDAEQAERIMRGKASGQPAANAPANPETQAADGAAPAGQTAGEAEGNDMSAEALTRAPLFDAERHPCSDHHGP
jgi:hypothetical protein